MNDATEGIGGSFREVQPQIPCEIQEPCPCKRPCKRAIENLVHYDAIKRVLAMLSSVDR